MSVRDLHTRIQDVVRFRNADSVEVKISHVFEEENLMLAQKRNSFIQISFNSCKPNR